MPDSTIEPTARPRRSRTRSRNVNGRPALVISTLKPHQYDLRPACASLICPGCKTWVPITGIQARQQKLVPHDTGRAGKDPSVRCQGSNRLIDVDVAYETWLERLQDGGAEIASRRPTTVLPRPFTPRTVQALRARAERTPAGRVADWKAVLDRVDAVDIARKRMPAGDAPLDGPSVPMTTLHPQRPAC
ncbi:hypothetical protein ACFWUQ_08805 [Streptomyces sp. NPDC058662]|uniref:hypothetical protein n=1 Tax=Streptomyces sp. NPDC058662 TaxID=3346583 RepID=UPI0036462B66